ncbi:hypothetical protein MNEG_0911 [Monoraphidium neglectum]|uniref:Uncharacterized protein n=1 Tax=Monoraphidium neglectum TaxID=145388 RepID=A0A0D2MWZ2_9CHLO|nr:hypothetical protein MNEG_0911 [Monoraphidium neglectum]KIZ07040.1 hypothetical protein MNEG_0911 [Monoraphidium neglectum]|eukprot:XP_013906059.1 hypothetical protein MNEG_0911 [Monoraphidium neglectum]
MQGVAEFKSLGTLELRFSDVLELNPAAAAALAGPGARLAALRLINVSAPEGLDLRLLAAALAPLRALTLVQRSKVAPLLAGDAALEALAGMSGLEELELQGRMCGVGDGGLLALRRLTRLRRLVVGWVPWQSQISQGAALQLLSGLPLLQSLKLSGAELLLPTGLLASTAAPQAPGANPAAVAPPAPAGYGEAAPQPAQPGQPQMLPVGGAVAAAAATASGRAPLRSMASAPVMGASLRPRCAAAGAGAAAGAHLDRLAGAPDDAPQLGGAAWAALAHVADLRLRFNCCGTSVERTLLALGPRLRARLAGLTWSYGKLGGPGYLRLLSSCTSLRSLKISMWYQDPHAAPSLWDLSALSSLHNLETLVFDKRPPFQTALPAQQASVSCPVTPSALRAAAAAWPRLRKLRLGLARGDFGDSALEQLPRFTGLESLTLHVLVAPKDDAWLGLAPLRLLSGLAGLRHLDWVPAERTVQGRLRPEDVQALLRLGQLHVLTLPASLVTCERMQELTDHLPSSCQLRLMAPAYCEHARTAKASRMQRLLSAASSLMDRAAGAITLN